MLSSDDLSFYNTHGYLILKDFASAQVCSDMCSRAAYLLRTRDLKNAGSCSVQGFKNSNQDPEAFFRESVSGINFFFQNGAFDSDGKMVGDQNRSIIKIGHALHDLDPVFKEYSHSTQIIDLARKLGYKKPLIGQSRYFFKLPGAKGRIGAHQDSAALYTEPLSCFGVWLALEDATVENGCIWVIPGSHRGGLRFRAVKAPHTGRQCTITVNDAVSWDESTFIPLEVSARSVILIQGEIVHKSDENLSSVSRQSYSIHIIEGDESHIYPNENWLQRPEGFGRLGRFDKI